MLETIETMEIAIFETFCDKNEYDTIHVFNDLESPHQKFSKKRGLSGTYFISFQVQTYSNPSQGPLKLASWKT